MKIVQIFYKELNEIKSVAFRATDKEDGLKQYSKSELKNFEILDIKEIKPKGKKQRYSIMKY